MKTLPILAAVAGSMVAWSATAEGKTFGRFTCSNRCIEHADGYEWARLRNVQDPGQCTSSSRSAREGCLQLVEERRARASGPAGTPAP